MENAQWIFWGCAVLFVLYQVMQGWKLGVMRQLVRLLALLCAYLAAIFGSDAFVPMLRPLGYPDLVLKAMAGAGLALVVFFVMTIVGAILFRKTSQQNIALIRFGYGALGAVMGLMFGLFAVWVAVLGVRVLGTLAEMKAVTPEASRPAKDSGTLVKSIAGMKHSLEQGPMGAVIEKVDPIPAHAYETLKKIGFTMSDTTALNRFLDYPGVVPLTQHPKIQALHNDPVITEHLRMKNYVALLHNERIVEAANDPALAQALRRFPLEKALDYAVKRNGEGARVLPANEAAVKRGE